MYTYMVYFTLEVLTEGLNMYQKFNVNYLPLFHHFKAIYQFLKHIVLVKIVANALLSNEIVKIIKIKKLYY
jgi:hypothetical protein